MTMDNKEALEAILEVKKVCEDKESCKTCPYNINHYDCLLVELPEDYFSEVVKDELKKISGTVTEKCDVVNHPSHYTQGNVECIEALASATINLEGIEAVCTANAIKYLWRWKEKNGTQDLDKAIWYINKLKKEIGNANT
jgi:hypothetical protein